MNKKINWMSPYHLTRSIGNIKDAVSSSWISNGKYVTKFEKKLSSLLKVKNILTVNNGTAALQLCYLTFGLKAGDEVIVPSYGYMAAANVAVQLGLTVKFADIDKDTLCISPKSLNHIASIKTKAVVVIHTYGNVCDMDKILKIKKKYNFLVIEDGAEAIGSKMGSKFAGSIGDAATFSFHAAKTFTTGEGGAVIIKNSKLFKKAKILRNQGCSNIKYKHIYPGGNFRMSNVLAAIGYSQIKLFNKIKKIRFTIQNLYRLQLSDCKNIKLQHFEDNVSPLLWCFVIIAKTENIKKKIIRILNINNIEVREGFFSSNRLKYFKKQKNLKNSDFVSRHLVCLPTHPKLNKKEIFKITNLIKGI